MLESCHPPSAHRGRGFSRQTVRHSLCALHRMVRTLDRDNLVRSPDELFRPETSLTHEWIGPDIRDSAFAHFIHLLLMCGVVVCGWKAISAFTRRPSRVFDGVRNVVYAAWLAVLFLILTKVDP